MAEIALLTPSPQDEAIHGRWREVFAQDVAPLECAGLAVEGRPWSEPGDLSGFGLVLPLLAWGYHREQRRWLDSIDRWEAAGVRLQNPPPVLRWNSDKTYLGRLAARGAPVVPTLYAERADRAALEDAAKAFGTDRVVAKPVASSTGWQTIRWPGDPIGRGPSDAAMIQPYLPRIETDGEVSLLWFGGRFSHAIRKRPQPGEFRVQPEYDGIIAAHAPAPDELAAAEAILAEVEESLLFARVDLVRGLSGAPELIELELVEPDLYLGYDRAREGALFAAAVEAALG